MAELARAVTVILQDQAVGDLLKENLDLKAKLDKLRSTITEVSLAWVGPSLTTDEALREELEELYEEEDDRDGDLFFWLKETFSLEATTEGEQRGRLSLNYGGHAHHLILDIQDVHHSEIRIGPFNYAAKLADWKIFSYVRAVRRNRSSSLTEFILAFIANYAAFSITADMELFEQPVSVEQYATLSGLSTEQVQAKFDIDQSKTEYSPHGVFDNGGPWMCVEYYDGDGNITPVQWETLERIFGTNAPFQVSYFDLSYDFVKRKALLL